MSANTAHKADHARTKTKSVRITDRKLKSLDPPTVGRKIVYDEQLKGFGVRINSSGKRSFVLNYYFKGRERRMKIGDYPTWSVLAARKRAAELKMQIANSIDPLETRQAEYAAPTVKDMWERYERDHLCKLAARGQQDQRSMYQKSIGPKLGKKKVQDVTFNDCEALHRALTMDRPIRANRVIEVVRRMFNLAIRWGWIDRNPAIGIEKNPENKRERYLSQDEIARLIAALDSHHRRTSCDAIKFMLFTGCRKGEALNARWDQFDGELKIWTKEAAFTKQKRLHRVPVSSVITDLLIKRRSDSVSKYIFAGANGDALTDVKKTWTTVIRNAEIDNVRIHDLRHTFASIGISQGQSLHIVGAMLGHTQPNTTARYAHLFDAPLIQATQKVANALTGVSTGLS